jgi:catechol 2,3-dioxygenase-like lactoylglutathione lyase family enzyme
MNEAGVTLRGMDHFTVVTNDLDTTRAFYAMIGLEPGPRPPDLGGVGLWLYLGGKPILHVVTRKELPADNGLLDHMAFRATGLRATVAMLREKHVPWRMRRLDDPFGVWQMFFKDPFGTNVELDFDGDEAPPDSWPGDNRWFTS